MNIASFSVKNALFVNLMAVFVFLGGLLAMSQLQREVFPDVNYDTVMVNTYFPVAPPDDVEKLITIPLEEEIRAVSGIKDMVSTSVEGISIISITLDPKTKDKPKVVDDIKNAVDRVANLPDDVEDPLVTELETSEVAVLEVYLGGQFTEEELRVEAEHLEDMLLDMDEVARIGHVAWRDKEFWVELSPQKMKEYYISFDEVSAALSSRNVTIPSGVLRNAEKEFNVRTTAEFKTPEEILEVIVRANDSGKLVRVKDIANVKRAFEDHSVMARLNGKEAMGLVVYKREGRDVIRAVKKINETLDEFRRTMSEGLEVQIVDDMSFYVKRRLGVLSSNALLGFFLVLVILFLFLDKGPAFLTALGIPMSLFMTFGVMMFFGLTINVVSMIGLIIVLGMLVDDGVVIAENVYRYIEQGEDVRKAAVKGTQEVALSVFASVVTTWAAFTPLLLMSDIMGRFVISIPIVVIVALAASLIEAFCFLPSHIAEFIRPSKKRVEKQRKKRGWFETLQGVYQKTVSWLLSVRYFVLVGIIIFIALTGYVMVRHMKIVFFSNQGIEKFFVLAEAEKGTSLYKLSEMMTPVEDFIATISPSELNDFTTTIGTTKSQGGHFMTNTGSHLAQISVYLTPFQSRKLTAHEVVERMRSGIEKIKQEEPGFEKLYLEIPQSGPPSGKPVQVGVRGELFETINEIVNEIKVELKSMPGVADIIDDYDFGKKQLLIKVDEQKAKSAYLTVGKVASTVRMAFRGTVATTIKPTKAEQEIDVLVRFPEEIRNNRQAFDKILIQNTKGDLVPLNAVAQVREEVGINSIAHYDGKRVVYVTAEVDDKEATSFEVNHALQKKFLDVSKRFPGYSLYFGGQHQQNMDSMKSLGVAAIFALFMIFIILSATFGSIAQPFVIMVAIPLAFMGVIWAFFFHGLPLSFFAFIGMIGLSGVVINSSIVLLDFVNKLRSAGMDRRESLIEAGRLRLRPILMTSLTTVAGLCSIAYNFGGGDPFIRPMALAIVWGLVVATFLTLLITPCIYAIVDDMAIKFLRFYKK